MQQPVGSGNKGTKEAQLRQIAKTKKKDPDEFIKETMGEKDVEVREPPDALMYHWRLFLDLSNARYCGGYAPAPIGYLDIWAWCQLYNIDLEAWEIETIRLLDITWMECYNDRSGQVGTQSQEPGSSQGGKTIGPVGENQPGSGTAK